MSKLRIKKPALIYFLIQFITLNIVYWMIVGRGFYLDYEFKNPFFLYLLIPFALLTVHFWFMKYNQRENAVAISSKKIVSGKRSWRAVSYPYIPILRFLTLFILIIALARPGKGIDYSKVSNLGIDIMVVVDVSRSMESEDFQPVNRLTAAKMVIKDFVNWRKTDKIGLAVFAGDAYLQCPLTAEHQMINEIVDEIDFDSVSEDGTAIGEALAVAAARMQDSKAKSKIILLLTDGVNNQGSIDPETAAKVCAEMGVKIYSVGIGKRQKASSNFLSIFNRKKIYEFDAKAIKKLSDITEGKFYRAYSSKILWNNIKDIDRLEKSTYEVKIYHEFFDRFNYFIIAALACFFLEILLRSLVYRKIP